jgi:hypothetical protein
MLLRCSVCKGQFDVDPDMKKPTVFCSHCGAQLQTVKPGRRRAPNNTQAVGALGGEGFPGLQAEAAPPEPTLGGFVEEFEAPAAEQGAGPIQPVASSGESDGFENFGGGGVAANQYGNQYSNQYSSAPASAMRRPVRRSKDNGMMIVMIVVGGVVLAIGVTIAVMFMTGGEEKPKPKVEQPIPDVGELFPDKKGK